MDNQSTSPQIIFPNVPDDFCPVGNWSEVLQQFIDTVLSNGTISVPGLGDINPEEITELQNEVTAQGLQITANSTNIATLQGNVTTLQGDVATLLNDVNVLQGDVTNLQGDVATLQGNVTVLQGNVITLQGNVTALQGSVTTLQSDVTLLQSRPIVTVRTGLLNLTGSASYTITFPALPSSSYGVVITPVGTATTVASGKYILQAGQTSTQFTILVNDNPATVTDLRWTAIHTN